MKRSLVNQSMTAISLWVRGRFGGWRLRSPEFPVHWVDPIALAAWLAGVLGLLGYLAARGPSSMAITAVFAVLVVVAQSMRVKLTEDWTYDAGDVFLIVAFAYLGLAGSAALLLIVVFTQLQFVRSLIGAVQLGPNATPYVFGMFAVVATQQVVVGSPGWEPLVVVAAGFLAVRCGEMAAFGLLEFLPGAFKTARAGLSSRVKCVAREQVASAEPLAQIVAQAPMAALGIYGVQQYLPVLGLLVVPFFVSWRSLRQAEKLQTAQRMAETDPLTGLPNRAKFFTRVEMEIDSAHRYGHGMALIMGDLDNFKRVNDTLGHLAGDEVLRTTAASLQRVIDNAVFPLARYGGEEFIIAVPAVDRFEAARTAERIRAEIELALLEWNTSISLGVAYLQQGDRIESLVDRADKALYSAKFAGKNRVHEWPAGTFIGPVPVIEASSGEAAA